MNRTQRILVTGGFGFVGQKLTQALRTRFPSARMLVIGRGGALGLWPDVEVLTADIASDEGLAAVERFSPTVVFHLAGISSIDAAGRDAAAAVESNLLASVKLAAKLRDCSRNSLFVFAGSGECYGASFVGASGPVGELVPLQPIGPYARAKTAAEYCLVDMLSGVCALVRLRLFNHTGPGQGERFVVPAFASQIAKIEVGTQPPVIAVGNLTAVRDFLDVDDVVRAYVLVAEHADEFAIDTAYTYNVCSGQGVAIQEILDGLLQQALRPIEVVVDTSRLRASDIPVSVGDPSKFSDRFAWRREISLQHTLSSTLAYWRSISPPDHNRWGNTNQ